MRSKSRPAPCDRAVAIAFCAIISIPLIVTAIDLALGTTTPADELVAAIPRWPSGLKDAVKLPGALKYYCEKRFGLRSLLVRLHGELKVNLLGTTANPSVLLGRDGWLFLAGERSMDFHRGAEKLSASELAKWVDTLEGERQWLEGKGIRYLVAIAPAAQTIYPEYLPSDIAPEASETATDQLIGALRAKSSVEVVDLRLALRAGKGIARLYHRTDTHWNLAGSLLGARAICERLGETDAASLPPALGAVASVEAREGDLARMLGLSGVLVDDDILPAAPIGEVRDESGAVVSWVSRDIKARPDFATIGRSGGPSAVLFRDSFGEALIPWLGMYFSRAAWRWTYAFDRGMIDREQPDVVIRQFAERKLMTIKPDGSSRELP